MPEALGDAVLVIDPSPSAAWTTVAPVVAAGCKVKHVASMTEALDVARTFAATLVIADVAAAPPKPERISEAARRAATVPLMLIASTETPSETLEAWSNLGATDLALRPLRLHDVQARLLAAKAAPRADAKKPRRVLLASDDALDLRRLDALLQLNGFFVLPIDLAGRVPEVHDEFDVMLLATRSVNPRVLLHQLRHQKNLEAVPAVVLTAGPEVTSEPHVHASLHVNAAPDDVVRATSGDRRVHPQLRVHQRVPFFTVVEFREAGNPSARWLAGYASNLSPGGLFVRSLVAGRMGSAVELRIHLANGHEVLEGTGVVAWSNTWGARGGFHFSVGMGLQFLAMSPMALMRVRELCGG